MNDSNVAQLPPGLGADLRTARKARGISLRALAKQIGVSPSLISLVERGKVIPSVGTLYAIVQTLDVSMDGLFMGPRDSLRQQVGPVLRKDARATVYLASGVRWERLSLASVPGLDFQLAIYDVGAESCPPDHLMSHSGEEHGYVVSGRLGVTIGDESYELGPDESVSFLSTTPHRLWAIGNQPARAIWLVVGRDSDTRFPGT